MGILFVYPNVGCEYRGTYSFGLSAIVAATESAGFPSDVIILHTLDDVDKLYEHVECKRPSVIGFSVVTRQLWLVCHMASIIKNRFPEIILACGGTHPTLHPDMLWDNTAFDVAFVGESDHVFPLFLERLSAKRDYHDLPNLAFRSHDRLVINPPAPLISNLDILHFPDRESYPVWDTINEVGYLPFQFSRGCPFACSYCINSAMIDIYPEWNKPRLRSPHLAVTEIKEALGKYDVHNIFIFDEIFGYKQNWLTEFCELYSREVGVQFQCMLNPKMVSEPILDLLSNAGCYMVYMGVECGNERFRIDVLGRRVTNQQILKAFALANRFGLKTVAFNMVGLPGETEELVSETLLLNRQISPTFSVVQAYYPFRRTSLGEHCERLGIVDFETAEGSPYETMRTILQGGTLPPERVQKLVVEWREMIYGKS